jgi:hypothetical protein
MPGRPVPVAIGRLIAGQEPIERGDQVGVRARPDLEDDQTGCGVRDEDRQQAVVGASFGDEGLACGGEIRQPASGAGPDRQLAAFYGKMLRSASRRRPSPPRAGADS